MRSILLILLVTLVSVKALAQINTLGDSINNVGGFQFNRNYQQHKHNYVADSIYFFNQAKKKAAFLRTSTTQLIADSNARFGQASLHYTGLKNGFKHPMEAYKSSLVNFETDGVAVLARFKLFGAFGFKKQWDDSLANNLTSGIDNFSPYFYFTPKAGKYERQAYLFAAGAVYQISQKIFAGTSLKYDYHWSTGSVDPRVETKYFSVKLKPEITYKISKKTLAGINATIGKGDENLDIVYKSDIFSLSQLFPERFYYLNYGYGFVGLKDRSVDKRAFDYKGAGISFVNNFKAGALRLNINYEQDYTKNFMPRIKGAPRVLSTFLLNKVSSDILINFNGKSSNNQIEFNVDYFNSSDQNFSINATNYFYKQVSFNGGYSILLNRGSKFQQEFSLLGNYNQYSKEDKMQAHYLSHSGFNTALSTTGYWLFGRDRLVASVTPSIQLPLKNELSVPATQQNIFTTQIAKAEYYYNSFQVLQGTVFVNYLTSSLFKNTLSGLFIKGSVQQAIAHPIDEDELPKYRKQRYQFSVGINVFL